jgi:menaquinone-dependent protoporphyrinogen oxidase
MAKILIIYGTSNGQTGKIANRLKDVLIEKGHAVDLFDCKEVPDSIMPENYEACLVGASVHAGGYQYQLKKWVKLHSQALRSIPSVFFSVCLGVLQNDSAVQLQITKIIEDFFLSTGWRPKMKAVFAGGLAYSQYNFLLKWWMRRIAKKSGGDTDTSKDYEYTDWSAVRELAEKFSNVLRTDLSQRKSGTRFDERMVAL